MVTSKHPKELWMCDGGCCVSLGLETFRSNSQKPPHRMLKLNLKLGALIRRASFVDSKAMEALGRETLPNEGHVQQRPASLG